MPSILVRSSIALDAAVERPLEAAAVFAETPGDFAFAVSVAVAAPFDLPFAAPAGAATFETVAVVLFASLGAESFDEVVTCVGVLDGTVDLLVDALVEGGDILVEGAAELTRPAAGVAARGIDAAPLATGPVLLPDALPPAAEPIGADAGFAGAGELLVVVAVTRLTGVVPGVAAALATFDASGALFMGAGSEAFEMPAAAGAVAVGAAAVGAAAIGAAAIGAAAIGAAAVGAAAVGAGPEVTAGLDDAADAPPTVEPAMLEVPVDATAGIALATGRLLCAGFARSVPSFELLPPAVARWTLRARWIR